MNKKVIKIEMLYYAPVLSNKTRLRLIFIRRYSDIKNVFKPLHPFYE
jgi:hypothetical protein